MRRTIADYPLVAAAVLLSLFGVIAVYSAGQTDVPTVAARAWRMQIIWLGLGVFVAFAVSRASVRLMEWLTVPAYLGACALLAMLLIPGLGGGAGDAASSKSWLMLGSHRLGQPSELAKITVVLMLARVLSDRREAPKSMLELWQPALVVFIPFALIMLQPDLGSAIAFIGIFFAMMYWSGVPMRLLILVASPGISLLLAYQTALWGAWFLLLLALVLWYKPYVIEGVLLLIANVATGVIAPLAWDRMKPYQQHRLLVFIDPTVDSHGSGWHVIQSQVAIGSGGWFGKGLLEGTQKRLGYLPEQHTDFIFSVVGEELGFVGVSVALALLCFLLIRCVRVATNANDSFSSLVALGLAASWLVHIVVNIGMTLGLMPITGIPLPFFSYGGSYLLACWIAVGILLRISTEGRGGRTGELAI